MTRICLHIDDPCKFELVWHILQQQKALICLDTIRQQQWSTGHNKISFPSVHAIVCFVCLGSFCDTVDIDWWSIIDHISISSSYPHPHSLSLKNVFEVHTQCRQNNWTLKITMEQCSWTWTHKIIHTIFFCQNGI